MKRPGFLTVRYLRYLARFKLTPYGRILVFLTFFAALGSITVEVPIYQLFCALFFLPAVAEAVGTILRPKLVVQCSFPGRATVGVPIQGHVTIENRGMFPAFDLMVGFFEADRSIKHLDADRVLPSLPVGGVAEIPFELAPTQRGRVSLTEVNVHSTFPLNLMRFGANLCSLPTLSVIPAYESLDELEVPTGLRGRPTHPAPLLGAKGESPEYVGNREYVQGEAAVRLDFRAWARLGRPVVREYQDEYSFRGALILDTSQTQRRGAAWNRDILQESDTQLEAAVSLTAAIAESLQAREIVIDLLAVGPEVYLFQSPHSATRFDSILEILTTAQGHPQNPIPALAIPILEALETISSLVVILLDWDDTRRDFIEQIRESGRGVKVLLVRSSAPTIPYPIETEAFQVISPELIRAGEVRSL